MTDSFQELMKRLETPEAREKYAQAITNYYKQIDQYQQSVTKGIKTE